MDSARIHRVLAAQGQGGQTGLFYGVTIVDVIQHVADQSGKPGTILLVKSPRRDSRCTQAQAAGHERRPGFAGNRVLVDRDIGLAEGLFSLLSGKFPADQINQEKVVVGSPGNNFVASLNDGIRHDFRISNHSLLIGFEARLKSLFEGYSLGRNHMHQWSALSAGKYHGIERLFQFFITACKDNAAPGATQGLVGG